MHFLCDGRCKVLKYVEGTSRYDKKTHDVLQYLLKTGELLEKPPGKLAYRNVNIVMSDKAREECNSMHFEHFAKGRTVLEFHGLGFYEGMPMVAYSNYPVRNPIIENKDSFVLVEVNNECTVLQNTHTQKQLHPIPTAMVSKILRPAWADSLCRSQGATIREPYTIWGADKMNRNDLYTALSRTARWDHVCLEGKVKTKYEPHVFAHKCRVLKFEEEKVAPGRIYEVSDAKNRFYYVGLTTKTLEERLAWHREEPTSKKMAEALERYEGITIRLLEEAVCTAKELDDIETVWIHKYDRKYGKLLLNVMKRRGVEREEPKVLAVEHLEVKQEFEPVDEPAKKRYRIRFNRKKKSHSKSFSYSRCKKEEALERAKAKQPTRSVLAGAASSPGLSITRKGPSCCLSWQRGRRCWW
jgi:hypothetical protein